MHQENNFTFKSNSIDNIPLGPVFKFGGTSMGSIERIEHVADLCFKLKPSAVIVSAMSGETNRLIELAHKIDSISNVPEYDLLVASGEQVSVALLSLAIRKRGIVPHPMLAPHAGILTNSKFSKASILKVEGAQIKRAIAQNQLPIIAGFQGVTKDGRLTSLGRGGSDTSAVAIAAGIGANECVIYTDVDGVFTTDPRVSPNARIIRKINYEEMLEMASQGSKVLHIRSVQLAAKWGIRLFVKNTFSKDEGTEMTSKVDLTIEGEVVTGIATTQNESWITIGPSSQSDFNISEVFKLLAKNQINVDIINQTKNGNEVSFEFTVAQVDCNSASQCLIEKYPFIPIHAKNDVSKVSIVGVGMRTHAGVAAKMFETLTQNNIEILLVTTSEIKVGCLIPRKDIKKAVQKLHETFLTI